MNHRPVCVKCEVEFVCSKNGVEVVDFASFGRYKVTMADEFECPKCKYTIIVGFADRGHLQHEEGFENRISEAEKAGLKRMNYLK